MSGVEPSKPRKTSERKQSFAEAAQPASLKKFTGAMSQSTLGATRPRFGSSTSTVVPSGDTEDPPGVCVTAISNGKRTTPFVPGGGAGKLGVVMFTARRFLIATLNVVRTCPGVNAPTADELKLALSATISTASPARIERSRSPALTPK